MPPPPAVHVPPACGTCTPPLTRAPVALPCHPRAAAAARPCCTGASSSTLCGHTATMWWPSRWQPACCTVPPTRCCHPGWRQSPWPCPGARARIAQRVPSNWAAGPQHQCTLFVRQTWVAAMALSRALLSWLRAGWRARSAARSAGGRNWPGAGAGQLRQRLRRPGEATRLSPAASKPLSGCRAMEPCQAGGRGRGPRPLPRASMALPPHVADPPAPAALHCPLRAVQCVRGLLFPAAAPLPQALTRPAGCTTGMIAAAGSRPHLGQPAVPQALTG
jgi:hypothetical protein